MENTNPKKKGRPKSDIQKIQYQIRLEPYLLQQLKCRVGKGKVSNYIRNLIYENLNNGGAQ